jgi:hypothetical protein
MDLIYYLVIEWSRKLMDETNSEETLDQGVISNPMAVPEAQVEVAEK